MANPFKEGEKHKKVPPGGNKPVETTPKVEEEPVVTVSEASEPVIGKDFLSQFVEPKSEGKSYSVYLSAEAGKKLEKLAKQLKCSKSKALDVLLRNAIE